jgi:undecaprenyl phosphate N,N'-diacetylbacillosamine 1-phosphate transferase
LYPSLVKPFFDKLSALIVLLISSPILLLVIAMLAIANRGKIWFTQQRPGKDGKIFTVVKFKTMNDARNERGELLPDDVRLTAIGNFVRKTSLDELPQLFNVLIGDMSIVGPRPLLVEYLPLYNDIQKRRHEVRPGITGWAQVNGRNAISWEQKFAYDVWYVDHRSFGLDVKILFLTVAKVFKAEGISSGTSVTMEKFRGGVKSL